MIPRDFSASGARIAYRTAEPVFIATRPVARAPPGLRDHIRCSSVHFQPIASEYGVRGVLALAGTSRAPSSAATHAHFVEVLAHEASVAMSRTALSPARSAR